MKIGKKTQVPDCILPGECEATGTAAIEGIYLWDTSLQPLSNLTQPPATSPKVHYAQAFPLGRPEVDEHPLEDAVQEQPEGCPTASLEAGSQVLQTQERRALG